MAIPPTPSLLDETYQAVRAMPLNACGNCGEEVKPHDLDCTSCGAYLRIAIRGPSQQQIAEMTKRIRAAGGGEGNRGKTSAAYREYAAMEEHDLE